MVRSLFATLSVFCFIVAAGCSRSGTNSATGPAPTTLRIAQMREPMALNPALENGTSSTQWGMLLFSYLVKFDDTGKLVGDLATEIPSLSNGGISRDGLTITYHVRPGVRFADGVPLTAADAAYSIAAIDNPQNNPQSRYGYDVVARADAPNPTTLVLHLKRRFSPLLTVVLAPQGFPVLPKHILQRYPNFNHIPFDSQPIGSGPYVVERWLRGDRVEMRANPYFWKGKPQIARMTVQFVGDPQTAINLLHTHEVQGYFNEQDYANYPILRGIPGYTVTSTPEDAVGAIIFNTQNPPTSDPRVRHALAEAIDIKTLIAKAYRGALSSADAGRGLFIWAYDRTAYPDIPYDPADARRLLDQAGWQMGPDHLRHKNGRALQLLFIIQAATPGDAIIGNTVAAYESAVGARLTLKQFNITQFVAPAGEGGPVYGGKFEMALYPFVNGDDPDTTDQFACANVPPNGYNKSRICDPGIDALLAAGRTTYDIAQRKAIYGRLERVLYREMPIALLYQTRQVNTFTNELQGQTTSLSGAFWNVGAWRLSNPGEPR